MLDDALAWAARGLRVFPIVPGGKTPPKGMRFTQEATTDPDKIRSWWSFEPRYNLGVTGGGGWLILDVDARKDGFASLMELDLPDATLTVATPGGGFHLYFRGPDVQNSVDRLGPGLDVRSTNGYVVGPGSYFADADGAKGYTGHYTIAQDVPVADAPAMFVLRCGEPRERDRGAAVSVDDPDDLRFAIHYLLKDAPLAVEGRGGNATTYAVAARLIEIGASAEVAADLMAEHWNERCEPPWSREEIAQIAANAAIYAQARQGSGGVSALADQGGDPADALPPSEATQSVSGKFDVAFQHEPLIPVADIPARDWLAYRMLLREEVTALAGPGGAGKSGFSIALAVHGAVGRDFCGYAIKAPFRTVIYNAEDKMHEMAARFYAACATYGIDPAEAQKNVLLWPGRKGRLRLVGKDHLPKTAELNELTRKLQAFRADALFLDPLNKLHSEEENDNTAMGEVMEVANLLCERAGVAGLVMAHTPKGGRQVGSSDAFRGAGAIVNAVRIAHTLFEADDADAALYGFGTDYGSFIRIDDAKMNHAKKERKPTWFERQSFPLPNGDTVQALRPVEVSAVSAGEAKLMATILATAMIREGAGHLTLQSAAKMLVDAEQMFRDALPPSQKLDNLRSKIEMRLAVPVTTDAGHTVRIETKVQPGSAEAIRYVTLG